MKKATKKIISLLLLFLGCLPWLFVLVFCIRQQTIRHQMKEKLEENIPPHTIRIPDKEVNWIEKGKEIWVNGKMFDIKTINNENGIITFTGLYDDDETILKTQLDKDWQKRSSAANQLLSHFFQTLQNFYFEITANTDIKLTIVSSVRSSITPALLSPYKVILTPPPQV